MLLACFALACSEAASPPPDACALSGASQADPYFVKVPALGELRVMNLRGASAARELLARTLQGVVNRTSARLYIVDDVADPTTPAASAEGTTHWLSVYRDRFGLQFPAESSLEDAVTAYAKELEGYVLVSEDEPWTFNAGSTESARRNVVVATSETAPLLDAAGLHQVATFVGRWPSAVACSTELAQLVGTFPHPSFAVLRPEKRRSRDFFVQQGMVQLGGIGDTPEWQAVRDALKRVPAGHAVYGYTANDGFQEFDSVSEISQAGDLLVPSDSMPNFSFHIAMRTTPTKPKPPADADVACGTKALDVVISISDGDNVVLATQHYATSSYWLSEKRGQLAISWSLSPALRTLAPAIYDEYARTVAPGDELVGMIGAGYAYGSMMPNADWYYRLTFEELHALGLRTLWLFDPAGQAAPDPVWADLADHEISCGRLTGMLDGYYPSLQHPEAPSLTVVGKTPVLRALGSYDDHPKQIADRIRQLLALPDAERPKVAFFSAASWNNDVPGLVAEMKPLEAQGVRFLSATAGLRCAGVAVKK